MSDRAKLVFEHRFIRWDRELIGIIQLIIFVAATMLIFGMDSNAWKFVLAGTLITSACHSTFVIKRGRELGDMPSKVETLHSMWGLLGLISAAGIYSILSPIWATVVNFAIWIPFLGLCAISEKIERVKSFLPRTLRDI
jgi:NAD/NADP transhydrogenase beta subunit